MINRACITQQSGYACASRPGWCFRLWPSSGSRPDLCRVLLIGFVYNNMCDTSGKKYNLMTKRLLPWMSPSQICRCKPRCCKPWFSELHVLPNTATLHDRQVLARGPHVPIYVCVEESICHHISKLDRRQLYAICFPAVVPMPSAMPVQLTSLILDVLKPIVTRVVASKPCAWNKKICW